MITLLNGRGQIGTELKKQLQYRNIDSNINIYHTWNHKEKSENIQKECLKKFESFLSENNNICFISTLSQNDNFYVRYKRKAERLFLESKKGYIIRLPLIIGNGICEMLKEGLINPFGSIEIISLHDACYEILNIIEFIPSGEIIEIRGENISAKNINNLIQFGKIL